MPRTDLAELFGNLQDELAAKLRSGRQMPHAGVQGETSEASWIEMLNDTLPLRYRASRGIVVDCHGETSDQVDIIVFDRQYSPLLFHRDQQTFVPAESVYAVLEVKPAIDASTLRYAADKAASVRRLRRTNAAIYHAGGVIAEPRSPFPILAGLVADRSGWSPAFGDAFRSRLASCRDDRWIDFGCALGDGAFRTVAGADGGPAPEVSGPRTALVSFFVDFLHRLQRLGTVPAMEYTVWRTAIGDGVEEGDLDGAWDATDGGE